MRLIGIVQRTNKDKNGIPIAAVLPLLEVEKGELRTVDAAEEFPTRGQVFWFAAHNAVVDALVKFRAESNPGQKDQFRLVDPEPVLEVLDLRRIGSATEVRTALANGIKLPGPLGTLRVLVWCKPDVLVGPVDLTRAPDNTLKLTVAARPRVPLFAGTTLRPIVINGHERLIRAEERAPSPSRFVDWDDDAIVLRRAIEVAVRAANQAGHERILTKKQIEDAARAIAASGIGSDAQLDGYRLERALALIEHTDVVGRGANDLADRLLGHPAIKTSLDTLRAEVAADVERSVRAALEQQLADERAALKEATEAHAAMKSKLDGIEQDVRAAEAAVDARLVAAIDRPLDLLAQVAVLRPFLGTSRVSVDSSAPATTTAASVAWSQLEFEHVKDKASLRRSLTGAARAMGVDPAMMLQVHAAIAARLVPVTLGPAALGALTAYAHGACGGRLLVVHVSPATIQHHELEQGPGGGLLAAVAAARDIDGAALVVFEGANRSPLEASLVPLLQLTDVGLSSLTSTPGLRLAASLVTGATTVPVTPHLWSHAVAISPEPALASGQSGPKGSVALSSELFALADEPTSVIDALMDAWPDCRELRPVMSRFGSALARLYDDEPRISEVIVSALILPYIATSFNAEEQAEVLNKAKDADGALATALRRLRKRLT